MRLLFFILLFSTNFLFAQDVGLTDLEKELQVEMVDSNRLKLIEKIAVSFRNSDHSKHFKYINDGVALSRKLNNKRTEGVFVREKGVYYKKADQLDSALFFYRKSQQIFLKIPDTTLFYDTEPSIGNVKKAQGKFDEAAEHFISAIKYFERQNTASFIKKGLITKFNLAGMYAAQHETTKSIDGFKDVLSNPHINEILHVKRASYVNLSAMYSEIKEIDSALVYAEKATKIAGGKRSQANLLINLGSIYEEKKRYDKSLASFQEALNLYAELEDGSGIIRGHNNVGNIYTLKGDYRLAEKHLLQAKEGFEHAQDVYSLEENYEMLISLYTKKGDFKKAFDYQQQRINLRDSILSLEKQEVIAEIETKYDVEKNELIANNALKEKEITKAKSEQEKSVFIYSILFIGLILIVFVLYFIYFKTKKKQQQTAYKLEQAQKQLTLEKQSRGSELTALRSQMNPHFVFNALNSIQDYIITNDKLLASDYLGLFADLMRKYLHFSTKENISLEDEIETLEMYLKLEKVRFEETLNYTINVNDEVDTFATKIPVMLLQPFVENAIKHGLLHKKGERVLSINFNQKGKDLIISIKDNGVGRTKSAEINKSRNKAHQSYATSAQEKRVSLLNEQSDKKISITYTDLHSDNKVAEGTLVEVVIPV